MKEVEVKAKLVDREAVVAKLKSLGCAFEPPITQSDSIYVENPATAETFRTANKFFLRLRVRSDGQILFTIKKRMENDLVAIEHELAVSSKEKMEEVLFLMGFKKAIEVNKTRVITHYNGCEICLDEVKDLGSFIEMEKLVENGEPEAIQTELFNFLQSLGVRAEDRVSVGYDILMLRSLENKK